jgi:hypothetical protein
MGNGMPYYLEKGALLRIFENYVNGNRRSVEAKLDVLQNSERNDSLDWILTGTSNLWTDPAFTKGPYTGAQYRDRILTEWFGYEQDRAGNWSRPQPPPATTGYWIGYRGDVHQIVRRAFIWALELALETGSAVPGNTDPWPIEIFWECPIPWFEAWVVSRKVPKTDIGLVTLILLTPSHRNAVVARSPIATSATTMPPGAQHPIPSTQDDYELLKFPHPPRVKSPVSQPPPTRAVPARKRDYATWVVTHAQQISLNGTRSEAQQNTAGPHEIGDLQIPQLAEWEGTGDVVVVSPSMAAGGIKHDGSV